MVGNAFVWIRQHPVRCVMYTIALGGAIGLGMTVRGILRGQRNELLTGIARSQRLQGWVQREFDIRYSLDSVALARASGFEFHVRGFNVDLPGAASAGAEEARFGLSGAGEAHGVRLGDGLLMVKDVRLDWPGSVEGSGFSWGDQKGEIISAAGFAAAPGQWAGSVRGLRLAALGAVDRVSFSLARAAPRAILIRNVAAQGIRADLESATISEARLRLLAAVQTLQAMGTALRPLPAQWSSTARRLATQALIVLAFFLLILKALLTRAPASPVGRIVVILAPFAAVPLLSLTRSWPAIALASLLVAVMLWALAYRHAAQWHERWEPAAVDIAVVLLALPILVLHHWPTGAVPQLQPIDRVTVAEASADNIAATLHPHSCPAAGVVRVGVQAAAARNVRLALDGGSFKSLDIEKVTAAGILQAPAPGGLRPLEYLPASWREAPAVPFCAAVTLQNSGPADLPEVDCKHPSAALLSAAVDFGARSARFAAQWNRVAAQGSGDLQGARAVLRTLPGFPLRIARADAEVSWTNDLAGTVRASGVGTGDVSVGRLSLAARTPLPCAAGPITVSGDLDTIRGGALHVDRASFRLARPDSGTFSASIRGTGLKIAGPLEAFFPESELQLNGTTSHEAIPHTVNARAFLSNGVVQPSDPVQVSANLWTGAWRLPEQSVTIRQSISTRIPDVLAFHVQASGGLASAQAQLGMPHLAAGLGTAAIDLDDLRAAASWKRHAGLAPIRITSGWNRVTIPPLPGGLQVSEISSLHLRTEGEAVEAPGFDLPRIEFPSVPRAVRFRVEGTQRRLSVTLDDGEELTLDQIETRNLRAALPGPQAASLDLDGSARVTRREASFRLAARARLTDASLDAVISEPLGAEFSVAPQAARLRLTRPLDTGKLLENVGVSLGPIRAQATLSALEAAATFQDGNLAALDLEGTLAAGRLATGRNFELSQRSPSTFRVTTTAFPKLAVTLSAPGVEAVMNGGKQRAAAAGDVALNLELHPAEASPLLGRLRSAATGLASHASEAAQVFSPGGTQVFPLSWDVEVTGGSPAVSFSTGSVAVAAKVSLRRVDFGRQSMRGVLDLHATARLADDHILLALDVPADIDAFGRRWKFDVPLTVALAGNLRPGTGGELFDGAYYGSRVAVGYGGALQIHASFQRPFSSGNIDGLAQAAVRWQNGSAGIDSYGAVSFRGLEAGAVGLPDAYLEDRLDGDIRFSTRGFRADRLTAFQLLVDASHMRPLDDVDLSIRVRSAADGAHLPGILQAASSVTLKPADRLLQFIVRGLNLRLPPRALRYRDMALDFRVQNGRVQTGTALLTLRGVQIVGVHGLNVDSQVRILWGGRGYEPAPRLRDLIYTIQRALER